MSASLLSQCRERYRAMQEEAALPAEEPPLPIGTGAGLKASGGWVAIRLTSGARLGRREVLLQEWYPLHLVLLPGLR